MTKKVDMEVDLEMLEQDQGKSLLTNKLTQAIVEVDEVEGNDGNIDYSTPPHFDNIDDVLSYSVKGGCFHFQWLVFVSSGLMFMSDAMEITLLSFLYSCLTSYWSLTHAEADSMISCVFIGELIGSLYSGYLSDKYGRKPVIFTAIVIISVGALFSALSSSLAMFLIMRSFVGIGIGSSSVPYDLLCEIVPSEWRGNVLVCFEFWWCFGSFITIFFAWLFLNEDYEEGWRWLIITCSVNVSYI
jgi:MFS transporter, putative metabolite:H+ symporter